MEYLNGTIRSSANTVAYQLAQEIPSEQTHLRIQTGYFTLNGLGSLKSVIDHLVLIDLPITIALGANEKATIQSDVDALYALIGCPRIKARLSVISCTGGLFHPKVVHLTRNDGSQLAYVGSANVTPSGFNGQNIEAGILLDSRTGDPAAILNEIAASIDSWFSNVMTGVTQIVGIATTQQLVTDGILGIVRQTVNAGGTSGAASVGNRMPLGALVSFPSLSTPGLGGSSAATPGSTATTTPATTAQPTTSQDILVAEIGKGDRWKQANFPYAIVQSYFGMNPTGKGLVDLNPVAANGTLSTTSPTQVVNVASQNYRLELGSVSGVSYPASGRPIAVFRKTSSGTFRYRVFLPSDPGPGHSALDAGLTTLYHGPKRQLRRVIMDSATLSSIWSACPV